ncbi:MAG: hypothetical protein HY959_03710 [Ignavibacteriae bacterium]|nr:hypothetical protein [Ignavibacteriota bacterium]
MPIVSTDIKIYLSGGASNSDPNASLGGVISSVELVDNSLHNLFDKITGSEADAGDNEYRCIFIKNTHATLTYQSAKVYIHSQTTSSDTSAMISVATENGSPVQTIANEGVAPSGQTFSTADGAVNALDIGDLAPGETKAIWIKWTVGAGAAAYANDTLVLKTYGDTEA